MDDCSQYFVFYRNCEYKWYNQTFVCLSIILAIRDVNFYDGEITYSLLLLLKKRSLLKTTNLIKMSEFYYFFTILPRKKLFVEIFVLDSRTSESPIYIHSFKVKTLYINSISDHLFWALKTECV